MKWHKLERGLTQEDVINEFINKSFDFDGNFEPIKIDNTSEMEC
jgi:hypothetical protein